MRSRSSAGWIWSLLALGCQGAPGDPPGSDRGGLTDGGSGLTDGGPRPSDGAPTVGPCGASCPAGSLCVGASCQCLPGFAAMGAACVRQIDPTAPADRSRADVCARWAAGRTTTAQRQYVPGAGGACDPGAITPEAILDAANRWTMYRWLVGLPPVAVNTANAADMQQCALLLGYAFRHDPPATTTCYTPGGAKAAGASMICSAQNAAGCMDLYTLESYARDNRLSHRKIVFGTNRDNVNFGVSSGGSCALYPTGGGLPPPPAFVALPNPGPAPIAIARTTWSLHQSDPAQALPIGDTQVFDETAGGPVRVRQNLRYAGINGWDVTDPLVVDHTYRVTLTDGAKTISYRTTLVDCK